MFIKKVGGVLHMKKTKVLVFSILLVAIVFPITAATFSVNEIRTDSQFQGAEIGLGGGLLSLTVGLDAIYLRGMMIDTASMLESEDTLISLEGAVLLPTVGCKIKVGGGATKLYVKGNLYKMIPLVDVSAQIGGYEIITPEIKEMIEDSLSKVQLYGGRVGVGAEYEINENIGLSGETGLRFHYAEVRPYENESVPELIYTEIIGLLGTSYVSLGLNFYF